MTKQLKLDLTPAVEEMTGAGLKAEVAELSIKCLTTADIRAFSKDYGGRVMKAARVNHQFPAPRPESIGK